MPLYRVSGGGGGGYIPPVGAFALPPKPKTGRTYIFPNSGAAVGCFMATDRLVGVLVGAPGGGANCRIRVNVDVAAAGATVECGLYKVDDSFEPTSFIARVGAADAATTGMREFPRVNLPAGNVVIAFYAAGASGFQLAGMASTGPVRGTVGTPRVDGFAFSDLHASAYYAFNAGGAAYTAFPATYPVLSGVNHAPIVALDFI